MEIVIAEGFGVFRCDTTSDKRNEFLQALKQIIESYQSFAVNNICSGKAGGSKIYIFVNDGVSIDAVIAVFTNVISDIAIILGVDVHFDVLLPGSSSFSRFLGRP